MQAAHFTGNGQIEFVEKLIPQPGPGELLVQVGANALCGSERGQFRNGSGVTPGHEAAGIVVANGPGTTTLVGTPGAVFLMDFCGTCRSCVRGFTNQCLQKRGDTGFTRDGGYGQFAAVSESQFFPISPDVTLPEATLLLDIMGTGGHALKRAALVRPDIESLLIMGAGPIGLGTLAMAKLLWGADFPVFLADMVPYRLALAESLGGRPVSLASATLEEGMRAYGIGKPDCAIDTSGKEAARRAALDVLGLRGVFIAVGHGEGLALNVSRDLISTERAILGSEYFQFNELPANLALLREHRTYLDRIITHRYPISQIQLAFETFFAGETGKVIVEQA